MIVLNNGFLVVKSTRVINERDMRLNTTQVNLE